MPYDVDIKSNRSAVDISKYGFLIKKVPPLKWRFGRGAATVEDRIYVLIGLGIYSILIYFDIYSISTRGGQRFIICPGHLKTIILIGLTPKITCIMYILMSTRANLGPSALDIKG